MFRITAIAALLTFAPTRASAQIPFATAFRDTSLTHTTSHDYAQLARAANGDAVMVIDLSETTTDRHIYAMRTTAGGVLQWMKRMDLGGGELWNVTDMALMPDGSIVITGYDALHGLFLRLDPTGTPVAAKWYSWTGISTTTTLVVLNDSTIVLYGNNRQGTVSKGWAAIVDGEGDLLEPAASLQVDGFELTSTRTVLLPPDKALLFGRSDLYGGSPDIGVAAGVIDALGTMLWNARFSSSGLQLRPVGSMVLPDGSVRLVVRNDGGFAGQSTIVIAVSPTGTVLWTKELHPKRATWDLTPLSVVPMSDTSMAIVGYYDPVHSGALLIDTAANVIGHESWAMTIIANEGYRDTNGDLVLGAHTPVSGAFDPALLRTYPDLHLCASATTSCTENAIALDVASGYVTGAQSLSVVNILPDFAATAITPVLNEMCVTVGMVEDLFVSEALMIAPNPASDRITIKGEGIECAEIIDATGRMMLARSLHGEGSVHVDVSSFAEGLYHVRIKTGNGWRSSKLVKE